MLSKQNRLNVSSLNLVSLVNPAQTRTIFLILFMSSSLKAPILFAWVEHGNSNISILPSRRMAQPVPPSILIQCLQSLVWVLICFSNIAYHTSRTLLASLAVITLSRPVTLGSKVGITFLSPTTSLERSFLQTKHLRASRSFAASFRFSIFLHSAGTR